MSTPSGDDPYRKDPYGNEPAPTEYRLEGGGGYDVPGNNYGDPTQVPPPQGQPGYGQPGYGDPASGPPGYGGPASGPPGYGDPASAPPGYGDPASAPPGYGQPPYGQPGFGDPGYAPPPPPKKSNTGLIIGVIAAVVVLVLCIGGGIGGFFLLRGAGSTPPSPAPTGGPDPTATGGGGPAGGKHTVPADGCAPADLQTFATQFGLYKDSKTSPNPKGEIDKYSSFTTASCKGEYTNGDLDADIELEITFQSGDDANADAVRDFGSETRAKDSVHGAGTPVSGIGERALKYRTSSGRLQLVVLDGNAVFVAEYFAVGGNSDDPSQVAPHENALLTLARTALTKTTG